jgi:hypothetical protein
MSRLKCMLDGTSILTCSDGHQQAMASNGEDNVDRLYKIARKYDPNLVFQRLVYDGQKLPMYRYSLLSLSNLEKVV